MLCEGYKKKTAQERKQHIEDNKLCLNRLGRHKESKCASKKACTACGERHHSSIHDAYREIDVAKSTHLAQESSVGPISVLLATARVRVTDRYGLWHYARALVDQGSESSIISERFAQELRLPRSSVSVSVYGIGGQKSAVARGRVTLTLSAKKGGATMSVPALILPRLTVYAGGLDGRSGAWPHLHGLDLADPEYCEADPVEILLGADVYATILRQGLRKGGPREPVAQNTTLGWILSGTISDTKSGFVTHTHQCRVEDNLASVVRRFWEQEEVSVTAPALSKQDLECEDHFVRTHSRGSDGRYTVRLPLANPLPDFSEMRRVAARVLKHMERKFERDTCFKNRYTEFMRQYFDLNHMTPVLPSEELGESRVCFLPHHGVMREASSTTKLRVVFNGSTATSSGQTLNQQLMTGPNLLPALADILLRWRRHRYVIATDIEKMYRQIQVHPQDRDLQRILWRNGPKEIKEFQLNTVTYGLSCAPFLAIRTLRQLADDENWKSPIGAAVLRSDVYMDDILTGAATLSDAKETASTVADMQVGRLPA